MRKHPSLAISAVLLCFFAIGARQRTVRKPVPDTATNLRGDSGRSGVVDARGPRTFNRIAWQTRMSPSFSGPLYANGSIYVQDGAGRVRSVDPGNGQTRWSSANLGNILTAPAATPAAVFVGSERRAVTALDVNSGSTLWSFATDSEVFAYPVVAGGVLFVATENGTVYAVDVAGHAEKWRYSTTAPIHGQPIVHEGVVVIGTENLIAIEAADGHELWRAGPFPHHLENYAAKNGVVFMGVANLLIAYDIHTGRELWRNVIDGASAVYAHAILNGVLFVADDRPMITSYEAATGTLVSAFRPADFPSGLIIADGVLYFGVFAPGSTNPNVERIVYALEVNTLSPLWTTTIAGDVQQAVAVADGRVFVLATNGTLYALE